MRSYSHHARAGSKIIRQPKSDLGKTEVGNHARVVCGDVEVLAAVVDEMHHHGRGCLSLIQLQIRRENSHSRISIGPEVKPGRDTLDMKRISDKQPRIKC